MTRDYVVKMSNLRNYTDKKIKDSISNLSNNYLFISLNVENLDIHQERQTLCAIIYLKSYEEVELTLDKLCTRRSRDKLGFKFKKLARPKEELEVDCSIYILSRFIEIRHFYLRIQPLQKWLPQNVRGE